MTTRRRYKHCLAGGGLLAGLLLGCWLAGLAAGADRPEGQAADKPAASAVRPGRNNGPEIADLGAATPKALVESMAKVLGENGKPHGWLVFQPPANRALAKEQLKMTLQMGAKAKVVVDLVQTKIGKMEAGMIKSLESGVNAGAELTLRYQVSQIAPGGKVDWDTLRITENGDKAQVAIASTGETIQLAKVNGKWYLDPEAFAKDAPGVKEMTGTLMKVLDQVEQKVKSGEINKQNFIQAYQDLINSSLAPGTK